MAMLNFKLVTQAVEQILKDNLHNYTIKRNAERNTDPNLAARGKGWIGIYRGPRNIEPYTTGNIRWLDSGSVDVEIQTASMKSAEDAEDKLQDAEKEIMDVFNNNLKLNSTVGIINGFGIRYEINIETRPYFHSAIITINMETRA